MRSDTTKAGSFPPSSGFSRQRAAADELDALKAAGEYGAYADEAESGAGGTVYGSGAL